MDQFKVRKHKIETGELPVMHREKTDSWTTGKMNFHAPCQGKYQSYKLQQSVKRHAEMKR
jgi:hypothetical protein